MHTPLLPWAEIPFFLSLARSGSFSAAAVTLGKDRTTIARRLARIESHLGQQLFDRTDDGLVMTAGGARVLEIAELAEQELSGLLQGTAQNQVQQSIRIAISDHLLGAIAAEMQSFGRSNPQYLLDFVTGDAHADLEHFEADIAVRLSGRVKPGLHTVPAGRAAFSLFAVKGAAPAQVGYIARPGEDEPPELIRQTYPSMKVASRANGVHATHQLVRSGYGCAILPDYVGRTDPQLIALPLPGPALLGQINVVCRFEHRRLKRVKDTTKALVSALHSATGIRAAD